MTRRIVSLIAPLALVLATGCELLGEHVPPPPTPPGDESEAPAPGEPTTPPPATAASTAGTASTASTARPAPVTARGDLSEAERTTIEIFDRASPSVVYVTNLAVRPGKLRLDETESPQGTGSGFVWDDQGRIVTNFHVIQSAEAIRITLADQRSFPARVVGVAPDKDLAVLEVEDASANLTPLAIGASENLRVGQHVFAIGNPFGLDHTLSTGVISGLGREIQSVSRRPITGVIQTDAAINPGNSGGPLLDSAGRLIGVNTAIYSPTGAHAGVGFAVPVDTVRSIVPQLIAHGRVIRPALGISIGDGAVARTLGVEGVVVLGVARGSGAETAGIQPARRDPYRGGIVLGDVIIGLNGDPIRSQNDLFRALDTLSVGDRVRVRLRRGDAERVVEVTLTALDPQ